MRGISSTVGVSDSQKMHDPFVSCDACLDNSDPLSLARIRQSLRERTQRNHILATLSNGLGLLPRLLFVLSTVRNPVLLFLSHWSQPDIDTLCRSVLRSVNGEDTWPLRSRVFDTLQYVLIPTESVLPHVLLKHPHHRHPLA